MAIEDQRTAAYFSMIIIRLISTLSVDRDPGQVMNDDTILHEIT